MNDQFKNEVIEELIIEMRSGFYSADFFLRELKMFTLRNLILTKHG